MQVSCPNCSTAYEIPPPVRPRRLRCARCETEWRALPLEPEAEPDGPTEPVASAPPGETPATGDAPASVTSESEPDPVPPPAPLIAEARAAPGRTRRNGELLFWLAAWVVSVVVIAGAAFAAWHGRANLEHAWPQTLWLFRLFPGGVPG